MEDRDEDLPATPSSSFTTLLGSFRYPSSQPRRPITPPAQSISQPVRTSPRRSAKKEKTLSVTKPKTTPSRTRRDGSSPFFKRSASEMDANGLDDEVEEEEKWDLKPNGKKKKKPARGYADPSVYAHLDPLTDYLSEGLDMITVGINPGVMSARLGHHYASPTNHFWKCVHLSGFTERRLAPSEAGVLMEHYKIGATNLVPRPSAEQSELSKEEMRACAPLLLKKVLSLRPKFVTFVGMGICEVVVWYLQQLPVLPTMEPSVEEEEDVKPLLTPTKKKNATAGTPPTPKSTPRSSKKAKGVKVKCGLLPITVSFPSEETDAREKVHFYVVPSTSARVVSYQLDDKVLIWKEMREQLERLKETGSLKMPEEAIDYRSEDLYTKEALLADVVSVKSEDGEMKGEQIEVVVKLEASAEG